MSETIMIRPAAIEDSADIARLITELGYATAEREMRARLTHLLAHPDYLTYVAAVGGRTVGLIGSGINLHYEKSGQYGRILALVVEKEHRRTGVGAALVAEIERLLKGRGVANVIVNSGSGRAGAHRFYSRMGYSETGVRFVKSL